MKLRQTKNKRILQLLPVFLLLSFSLTQGMYYEEPTTVATTFATTALVENGIKRTYFSYIEEGTDEEGKQYELGHSVRYDTNDLNSVRAILEQLLPNSDEKKPFLASIDSVISEFKNNLQSLENAIKKKSPQKVEKECRSLFKKLLKVKKDFEYSFIKSQPQGFPTKELSIVLQKITRDIVKIRFLAVTKNVPHVHFIKTNCWFFPIAMSLLAFYSLPPIPFTAFLVILQITMEVFDVLKFTFENKQNNTIKTILDIYSEALQNAIYHNSNADLEKAIDQRFYL